MDQFPISRRKLLSFGGIAALSVGSGFGVSQALQSTQQSARTYLIQQGKLRWEVTPVESSDENTVEEFYNYHSSSSLNSELTKPETARVFLYNGPVASSLVFLNDAAQSSQDGAVTYSYSGLSRSNGEWAVKDDPISADDDFESWENGNQRVEWEWDATETDGGAFWGGFDRDDYSITMKLKEREGITKWEFITGTNNQVISLYPGKSVYLKPIKQKSVKLANIDIIPDSGANEFDPYNNGYMWVAIKSPPAGANDEHWVSPEDVDPGNYSVNFGSLSYLAGGNAAQPQKYFQQEDNLLLKFKIPSTNFSLEDTHGYLTGKIDSYTFFRGKDQISPGGFNSEQTQRISVETVQSNPDEFVTLKNETDEQMNLGQWTLENQDGWLFKFPEEYTLESGETVTIYTKDGEWTDDELYWNVDADIWNDTGKVIVKDNSSRINTVFEY